MSNIGVALLFAAIITLVICTAIGSIVLVGWLIGPIGAAVWALFLVVFFAVMVAGF